MERAENLVYIYFKIPRANIMNVHFSFISQPIKKVAIQLAVHQSCSFTLSLWSIFFCLGFFFSILFRKHRNQGTTACQGTDERKNKANHFINTKKRKRSSHLYLCNVTQIWKMSLFYLAIALSNLFQFPFSPSIASETKIVHFMI